jgi:hypothetical protein
VRFKGPRMPKKVQFSQERVEYKVFLFNDPLKGSKSLKIFKINLTFRFDKLSHLSKSVHIGENSDSVINVNFSNGDLFPVIFVPNSTVKLPSRLMRDVREVLGFYYRARED